jgi:hypothetical protein
VRRRRARDAVDRPEIQLGAQAIAHDHACRKNKAYPQWHYLKKFSNQNKLILKVLPASKRTDQPGCISALETRRFYGLSQRLPNRLVLQNKFLKIVPLHPAP